MRQTLEVMFQLQRGRPHLAGLCNTLILHQQCRGCGGRREIDTWQPYSLDILHTGKLGRSSTQQKGRKVVLLEFTAAWCLNCHALEQAVLHHPRVLKLLNSPDKSISRG